MAHPMFSASLRVCFLVLTFAVSSSALFFSACGEPPDPDACESTSDCTTPKRCIRKRCTEVVITNNPPLAHAGDEQRVRQKSTVKLDGSKSSDPEGDALSFTWLLVKKPDSSQAQLDNPSSSTPSFVADLPGFFVFQLNVSDGKQSSRPSQVQIEVYGADQNSPPVAKAGDDRLLAVGVPFTLDGSLSSDFENDPLTFAWTLQSKPPQSQAQISDPTSKTPSFTPDIPGKYILELVVDDGLSASTPDSITLEAISDFDFVPTLTKVDPTEAFEQTKPLVKLTGTQFSARSRVFFADRVIPEAQTKVLSETSIEIELNLLAFTPGEHPLKIRNPNGKESNPLPFKVLPIVAPTLDSLSPSSAAVGSKLDVVAKGTGFLPLTEILFQTTPLPVKYVSSTEISFSLDLSTTSSGTFPIRAQNPGGRTSAALDFQVVESGAPPVLRVLNPPSAVTGATIPFSVHGSGFSPSAVILFGNKPIPSNRIRRDEIAADPSLDLKTVSPGEYKIRVRNIDGQLSNEETFLVEDLDPTPVLDRIIPFALYLEETNSLFVYGLYFRPGIKLFIGGNAIPAAKVNYRSNTFLEASVDTSQGSWSSGESTAYLENPSGKKSNAFRMTVTYRLPSISSITPSSWQKACATTLQVFGNNFRPTSSLTFQGTSQTLTFTPGALDPATRLTYVSPTQLSFPLDPANLATGAYKVTVRNAANAVSTVVNFTISSTSNIPVAMIREIRPSSAQADTTASLTLYYETGGTFYNGAVVEFNGKPVPTTCSSTSTCYTLGAQIDLKGVLPGKYDITVTNPCGTKSVPLAFLVTDGPKPYISHVSPPYAFQGDKKRLFFTGVGFHEATAIRINNQKITTLFRSETEITATQDFDFTSIPAGTSVDIVAENSPTAKSPILKYPVLAANHPLRLTSISSYEFERGKPATNLTLQGVGFTATTEIFFNGQKVTSTFQSATAIAIPQLDFTSLPAGLYYIQAKEGSLESNALPLLAKPKTSPLLNYLSPSSEFLERSFTVYIYGGLFCETATPTATTCLQNPKVVVLAPNGQDKSTAFSFTRAYVSSFSPLTSSYVYGTFNSSGLAPGAYTVYLELPTGERSNPGLLSIKDLPTPTITSLSWTPSGTTYAGRIYTSLRIYGAYWRGAAAATTFLLDGQPLPYTPTCTFSSPTSNNCLLANFSTVGLAAGPHTIQYQAVSAGQTYTSAPFNLTLVEPPTPAITTISPVSASSNTQVSLTINGSNFASGAILISGLNIIPTTFSSATRLTASFDTASLKLGSNAFVVQNPDGKTSGIVTFTVLPPLSPLIVYADPDVGYKGLTSGLNVFAYNLAANAVLTIDGQTVATIFQSSSPIPSLRVSAFNFNPPAGGHKLQITSGGKTSNTFILGARSTPQITSLSPTYTTSSTSSYLYVYATGFDSGAQLLVNGQVTAATRSTSYMYLSSYNFGPAPKDNDIQIRNSDGSLSAIWKFSSITTTRPYISSSSPSTVRAGIDSYASNVPYVYGGRFTSAGKIYLDNQLLTTRYSSTSYLYVLQALDFTATMPKVIQYYVQDTAGRSNYLNFRIESGANQGGRARITDLTPFATQKAATTTVVLTTSGLDTTKAARWQVLLSGTGLPNPRILPLRYQSSRWEVDIDTSTLAIGTFTLQIQNKGTLETSGGSGFAIFP